MPALKRGLRNNRLAFFLDENFLGSYAELLKYVAKYVQTKEGMFLCQKEEGKRGNGRKRSHEEETQAQLGTTRPLKNPKSDHPTLPVQQLHFLDGF